MKMAPSQCLLLFRVPALAGQTCSKCGVRKAECGMKIAPSHCLLLFGVPALAGQTCSEGEMRKAECGVFQMRSAECGVRSLRTEMNESPRANRQKALTWQQSSIVNRPSQMRSPFLPRPGL